MVTASISGAVSATVTAEEVTALPPRVPSLGVTRTVIESPRSPLPAVARLKFVQKDSGTGRYPGV